ncbi:MAG: zinc-ribbon domain-containing protein, partial [Deltaproteobacteria bacterium]|nr:zinc-ribbon domain-containing protein [Deltaproteobacteria bacterium]
MDPADHSRDDGGPLPDFQEAVCPRCGQKSRLTKPVPARGLIFRCPGCRTKLIVRAKLIPVSRPAGSEGYEDPGRPKAGGAGGREFPGGFQPDSWGPPGWETAGREDGWELRGWETPGSEPDRGEPEGWDPEA